MCDSITNGCGGGGGGTTTVVNSPVTVTIASGGGGNGTSVGNTLTLDVLTSRLINSNGLGTFNLANANFFSGDGSNIANLNASSISSGTINSAYLETTGVLSALYGGEANVPQLIIDQWGRVSNAVNVQTQWTPTGLFNIATANGVSIGTLNDPPTGSNLYVLGTANIDTINVDSLFANTVTIFGLNTLNVYGTSNMNAVYSSNYYGNASTLSDISGSNVTGNVSSATVALVVSGAAQPNITSVGVLTNLVVQGQVTISNGSAISNINSSNLVGNVANANVALVVSQASQPNITSVGTLTGLTINGLLIASNGSAISNLNASNLVGNVASANLALTVTGSNQPNITNVGTLSNLTVSGLLIAANGSGISNINGSNVTGNVANSTVALTVSGNTQSNITSVGTLVSLDVSGQISGDGYNITNLNPANINGTVRTAASVTTAGQPNITSVGILSNLNVQGLATISNGSAISNLNSSNIFGTVYAAQVVTQNAQPNITSVGILSGLTVSNLLIASNASGLSNLNASNLTGNVANSNVALVVSQASQPNITSVGTLTELNVQGLLIASDGSGISNLRSANITGTVATAGVVTNPAQVNITSVGTLTSLGVTGILTAGLHSGNGSALSNINASNIIGDVPLADSVLNSAQPNITSVGLLSNLAVSNSVTTGNVWANSLSITGLSGQNPVKFVSDSGTFFMASSGRIGINMTSPSSQLEIGATGGATAIAINLSDSSVGAGNGVSLTKDAGQNMILASQNLADAWIVNYGTTRFRMYSTTGQSLLAPLYLGPTITPPPSISTTLYVLGNAYISNTVTTTNVYANQGYFSGITLSGSMSASGFSGGAFTGGTFQGTTMSGTTITASTGFSGSAFTGYTFSGTFITAGVSVISPGFSGSAYTGGAFYGTTMTASTGFTGGTFQGSTMSGTLITASTGFTGGTFQGSTMSGTLITASTGFTGGTFQGSTMSGTLITASTGFTGAAFTGGTFYGTTANVGSLNVFTRANVTQLTVSGLSNLFSANADTLNTASANVTSGNVGSLNVFTGANVTQLTVSGLSNLFSANAITLNTASANVTSGNVGSLNVFTGANITQLSVTTLANVTLLNVSTTANVTNLTVTSNIVPAGISGNTYLTGNIIVSGNVFTSIGAPLGAGGGYYFSLPSDITLQTPYTGGVYGTTYPLSVGLSNGFTINGTSTLISVSTNGNFKFVVAGAYKISAVFLGSDNLTGLALGSNAADVHGTDQGYLYRYTTQITQNPTELIEIPFNVTDVSKYYYLDLFATASGTLKATTSSSGGTYLTITPLQGGGLATGGPGGTPGTQWISSGSNIYFPNSVGIGAVNPQYNLDVSTGTTATQRLITSNISSLGVYGPILNVTSNVLIQSNLAVGGGVASTPPYALYVNGQGYFSQHVSYDNFAGYRNRLINGTFRVAYRANTITISNTSSFSLSNSWVMDRWHIDTGNLSTSNVSLTIRQDSPYGPNNGFSNIANVYVSRAFGSTLDNTYLCPLVQTIESSGTYDLRFGQATANPMVLSFTANTTVAGTYSVVLRSKVDNTYFANLVTMGTTFNRYTVYVPPCTIGTWGLGINGSVEVCLFGLSFGSTRANVAPTTSWTASPGYAPMACTGATNWLQTTGAFIQVTGVQLELGTIATPFEVRLLADTVRFCQRYFENNPDIQYASALVSGRINSVPFVVTKRDHGNVSVYTDLSNLTSNTNISRFTSITTNGNYANTAITSYISSEYGFTYQFTQVGGPNKIDEAQFVWKADAEIY